VLCDRNRSYQDVASASLCVSTIEEMTTVAGDFAGLSTISSGFWSSAINAGLSTLPCDIGPVVVVARASSEGRRVEPEPEPVDLWPPGPFIAGSGTSSDAERR
jgi:hypothetical protein